MEVSPSLVYGASLLMKLGAIPHRFKSCNLRVNEEEKKLRAQIAYDIRAELVCCNMFDKLERFRQEIDAQKPGWSQALSEMDDAMEGHEICYWGEVSARIAENPPNYHTPDGLCGDKSDHEPHEHHSETLGTFWCTANQKTRLPYAAEKRNVRS